jgi:MFS family permease
MAFFLFASAYWSLLPLIARNAEGGGSELYGALMALIGAGAVTGALLLPRLSKRFNADASVRLGTFGTIAALLAMAASSAPAALMVAAFLGGLSWIAVLTSFNVSAQTALPDWVRARGLAVFLMVFFGSMSLGSVIWGQIATLGSIQIALLIAALGLGLGAWITRQFEVGQGEALDLSPASAWPQAPALNDSQSDDIAAMVIVTYKINPADEDAFLTLLNAFSKQRMRDGATRWDVSQNVEDPTLWVETFHLPSWAEHLAQHERVTRSDLEIQDALKALDRHEGGPLVRHYIKPE